LDQSKNILVKRFGLRGIALFEAGKGLLALMIGIAGFTLRHRDMHAAAEHLLRILHKLLHVSPEGRFARELLHAVSRITPQSFLIFAVAVLAYVTIRFVEAIGLWLAKEWAEWFALISGSLYVPIEILELIRHPTWIKWTILTVNLLIVAYMAWFLMDSHRKKKETKQAGTESSTS
jgi:uncharacterized membrane protein (DUF2068 family)